MRLDRKARGGRIAIAIRPTSNAASQDAAAGRMPSVSLLQSTTSTEVIARDVGRHRERVAPLDHLERGDTFPAPDASGPVGSGRTRRTPRRKVPASELVLEPNLEVMMGDRRKLLMLVSLLLLSATNVARAQDSVSAVSSPVFIPSGEQQIAAAVLPLPAEFQASATVLGYDSPARLTTLRPGTGPFICLASDPKASRFHVACYHKSLEPFMARGRALRARGVKGDGVDSVRFAEVRRGRLKMPRQPAALYSLTGDSGSFLPATGAAPAARALFVIYVPGATAASTGLSAKPTQGTPWIMQPGTPKAHIMFVPRM